MHITQHLHPLAWEDQRTTIQEKLNNYINDHGRTNLPPCQKRFQQLHQRLWEDQPTTMSKKIDNYINDNGSTNLPPCRKIPTITSTTMGGPTYHHVRKSHVYLRLPDSSIPLGRNLDLKYTKLLFEVFKLHFG